jgi:hypothetical protein
MEWGRRGAEGGRGVEKGRRRAPGPRGEGARRMGARAGPWECESWSEARQAQAGRQILRSALRSACAALRSACAALRSAALRSACAALRSACAAHLDAVQRVAPEDVARDGDDARGDDLVHDVATLRLDDECRLSDREHVRRCRAVRARPRRPCGEAVGLPRRARRAGEAVRVAEEGPRRRRKAERMEELVHRRGELAVTRGRARVHCPWAEVRAVAEEGHGVRRRSMGDGRGRQRRSRVGRGGFAQRGIVWHGGSAARRVAYYPKIGRSCWSRSQVEA